MYIYFMLYKNLIFCHHFNLEICQSYLTKRCINNFFSKYLLTVKAYQKITSSCLKMSKISIITQRTYFQRKLMSIKYTFLRLKCSALTDNFCDVNKKIPALITYTQSPLHSQCEWESGVCIFIRKLLCTHTALMGSTKINIYNVGHFLISNC